MSAVHDYFECPATMCPLVAPDGSPWIGERGGACPGHDGDDGGCPWWSMACSTGGIQAQVEQAARAGFTRPRTYDCPKAGVCRWQQQAEIAGRKLCPPRDALGRGLDPRVTLF